MLELPLRGPCTHANGDAASVCVCVYMKLYKSRPSRARVSSFPRKEIQREARRRYGGPLSPKNSSILDSLSPRSVSRSCRIYGVFGRHSAHPPRGGQIKSVALSSTAPHSGQRVVILRAAFVSQRRPSRGRTYVCTREAGTLLRHANSNKRPTVSGQVRTFESPSEYN